MAWWERAYVGQKVVCIRDEDCADYSPWNIAEDADRVSDFIRQGTNYEISGFGEFCGVPMVYLHGIRRKKYNGIEAGFHPNRFRPIQDTSKAVEELKRKDLVADAGPLFGGTDSAMRGGQDDLRPLRGSGRTIGPIGLKR